MNPDLLNAVMFTAGLFFGLVPTVVIAAEFKKREQGYRATLRAFEAQRDAASAAAAKSAAEAVALRWELGRVTR